MRTKTATTKKVLVWEEFRDGLVRAGFENKPEHPDWMMLKGDLSSEGAILAIPGKKDLSPLPGESVYSSEIHRVWFAVRTKSSSGWTYKVTPTFPASILS
jgi:hypothetical protein